MRVLITGASGFIGAALAGHLRSRGHEVVRLGRRPDRGDARWDPATGQVDAVPLAGADALVHLAGESIAAPWTPRRRRRIRASRVETTARLAFHLAGLAVRPAVLIGASACGIYGDTGDRMVSETSPVGRGFLAGICRDWEAAMAPAARVGIRCLSIRFGLVLDGSGGLLAAMLPAYRLGFGAVCGDGRQWLSWTSLLDAVRVLTACLENDALVGPINATTPWPVRQRVFAGLLARSQGHRSLLRVPAPLLRALGGDQACDLLLAGQRVDPARLRTIGFRWLQPRLSDALHHLPVT